MNTFKRKTSIFSLFGGLILAFILAGCASDEKRYITAVQDTNDRIERMRKADAEADATLAKALEVAAASQPALVAAVASNVMMARAFKGGGAAQTFIAPERPRSFGDELRQWAGILVPGLVQAYGMNRATFAQVKSSEYNYLQSSAAQAGETARVGAIANMAIGLKPGAPNVTTTYTFGRDGLVGGGTQTNNNSTQTTCSAGNGAAGGGGGSGGNGGGTTGAGAPGAAGAPGGAGGNAC